MASATLTAGKEIVCYCTSCKMDLNHVIVAMKGDLIARVQCHTCKKEHAYKSAKGVKEPSKTAKAKATKAGKGGEESSKSTPIEVEWRQLMNTHRDRPAKPYSARSAFTTGDRIQHPTFGDGVVGKLIFPNKVEVVFQHDMKVLIHAGASASA
jgi:hypothetical protein